MNHEDELSFHEDGADVPDWAVWTGILVAVAICGLALFLILNLSELTA